MRVLRDVIVDRTTADELLAVSHVPAIIGEEMMLDLLGAGESVRVRVTVLDSRPLIVDGAVRHRLRLALQVNGTGSIVPSTARTEAN